MNTTSTSIHPETAIGYVHLAVSDLGRSLAFYDGKEEAERAVVGTEWSFEENLQAWNIY